jgi:choline dehydrogenase-like flavoprotein
MNPATTSDVLIIGSGAGGAAAAHALVRAGLSVVLVEKGEALPRDASTLDFDAVIRDGRFTSREVWRDGRGRELRPEERFNLGGKTRWYGAALLRYGAAEFGADEAHGCPAWPFGLDTLAPYYDTAEALLGVRHFDCEPGLARLRSTLARRAPAWRTEPLPLGLAPAILAHPHEARRFDGFASVADLKADAVTSFLAPVRDAPNLRVLTGCAVRELLPAASDPVRVEGVRLADGRVLRARAVLLAAGALHSPRLLQRFVQAHGLAARLPCQSRIGAALKLHLLTAMVALSPRRQGDLLRKTILFLNDAHPHSSVQPLGFDGELIATLMPRFLPRFLARALGNRAYGFFLQTEDAAHADNRVVEGDGASPPTLDYDARRSPAARREHRALVASFRRDLARCGFVAFSQAIGPAGTAHVSGTLSCGADPATSVVDAAGRVHGMAGLYVVDGSVLPRSSRVNPSLTIYAWSLRVSAQLARELRAAPVARSLAEVV